MFSQSLAETLRHFGRERANASSVYAFTTRLQISHQLCQGNLHAEGHHFEHRERNRFPSSFYVANEATINAECISHDNLSHVSLSPQIAKTATESGTHGAGRIIKV